MSNEVTFPQLPATEALATLIYSAFELKLPVEGGWGYTIEAPLKLLAPLVTPLAQTEYTLASIRTQLEMHMTLPESDRYGGINLNEYSRAQQEIEGKTIDIVTYKVSAIKESEYNQFIEAYKEGYGTPSFDMEAHFQARKEATLTREITLYFDITDVL